MIRRLSAMPPGPRHVGGCSALYVALALLLWGCASEGPSRHGPRHSPGAEVVEGLHFSPLRFTVPRVGRE
ncbi:MAG TPA: hypothetical protein VLM91_25430, partial [Candidatus Methylomirabilis sp.]|nr:hypothetical protein [Candidatus Methylomirabilis sp.]